MCERRESEFLRVRCECKTHNPKPIVRDPLESVYKFGDLYSFLQVAHTIFFHDLFFCFLCQPIGFETRNVCTTSLYWFFIQLLQRKSMIWEGNFPFVLFLPTRFSRFTYSSISSAQRLFSLCSSRVDVIIHYFQLVVSSRSINMNIFKYGYIIW